MVVVNKLKKTFSEDYFAIAEEQIFRTIFGVPV